MSDDFKQSAEWIQGDTSQRAWGEILAERGSCVIPTYAFDECVPETKAPVMLAPTETCGSRFDLLVTPDLLSLRPDAREAASFHEVKSKSVPSWRRIGSQWEHGFDYDLCCEYERVQSESGVPVWVVVHELRSPMDPHRDSPLVASGVWLTDRLSRILDIGEHRPEWPGGRAEPHRRGRRGMGGWLWPRSKMALFDGDMWRPATEWFPNLATSPDSSTQGSGWLF